VFEGWGMGTVWVQESTRLTQVLHSYTCRESFSILLLRRRPFVVGRLVCRETMSAR
jgi:hypothetical protein